MEFRSLRFLSTRRGSDWFAREAKAAGIDGVICVDISPEEEGEFGPALRQEGIHLIRLATPKTDDNLLPAVRSEESSEGKECDSMCSTRSWTSHKKHNKIKDGQNK